MILYSFYDYFQAFFLGVCVSQTDDDFDCAAASWAADAKDVPALVLLGPDSSSPPCDGGEMLQWGFAHWAGSDATTSSRSLVLCWRDEEISNRYVFLFLFTECREVELCARVWAPCVEKA